jgi:low temperature requirement protein LtrA
MSHAHKPKLRNDHHLERHASWLELFFDLVFAVTVSQLAHRLTFDLDALGLAQFLGLFVPVWWAWVGQTMFATRFESDDPVQRVLTLFQMLCAAIMAVQAGGVTHEQFQGFALAYAALRMGLVLQYLRVWRHDPSSRAVSGWLAGAFSVGVVCAVAAGLAPASLAWGLWLLALAVDLIGPRLGVDRMRRAPVHRTHLPERFALFTLIFLGESLAAVVRGLAAADLWWPSVVIGVFAFVIASCLWWLYFDHFARPDVGERLHSGQTMLFMHLPLMLGLAALVAGVERALQESSDVHLSRQSMAMVGGGSALWLLAFVGLQALTVPATVQGRRKWPPILGAALALGVMMADGSWMPMVAFALYATIFVALVVVHERRSRA